MDNIAAISFSIPEAGRVTGLSRSEIYRRLSAGDIRGLAAAGHIARPVEVCLNENTPREKQWRRLVRQKSGFNRHIAKTQRGIHCFSLSVLEFFNAKLLE